MKIKALMVALVSVSFLAGPALAGTKSMRNTSTAANNCKSMMHAKHVKKDAWDAELNKCLDNPTTYQ